MNLGNTSIGDIAAAMFKNFALCPYQGNCCGYPVKYFLITEGAIRPIGVCKEHLFCYDRYQEISYEEAIVYSVIET